MKRTDPPHGQRWAVYSSHLGDYMRRWIVRTPWGTLRIHNILKSDEGRDFHDHPFHFTSFVLCGGYTEHRPYCACGNQTCVWHKERAEWVGPGSVVRRDATDLHRLELSQPAWTLVVTSKYIRKWGFQTPAGWVPYDQYDRSFG